MMENQKIKPAMITDMKMRIKDILMAISWRDFTNTYFERSSSWFYHKMDGIDGNGGVGGFTEKEAEQMKNALVGDDFDEFARLLNYHWELSKKIDGECTNSLIEHIFLSIDEFLEARFICGAGGGGFLQAILKKGCTKNMVHDRLKEVFGDCDIDVYDTSLSF